MLTSRPILFASIALILSCSAVKAQLELQQVAKFGIPNEKRQRFRGAREVEFADDESKMIAAFYGSTVQLFDLEKNVVIGELIRTSGDGEVGFVNDKVAYTADWDSMRLWDMNSGQQVGDSIPHRLREDTIIHPAIHPKGNCFATRVTMKSVQLWDVSNREPIGKTRTYASDVHSLRFSKDGNFLMVSAGGAIHAIDSDTGENVAGPIKSEWSYKHFSKQQMLVTTEQVKEGMMQLVMRSTDQKGWPETHRSNLPGKLKRMVALNDNQVLLQALKKDYSPALFIISLDDPGTRIEVDSNADRAFNIVVPEDKQHWISSNIRNISCQKFGEPKPVWLKQVPPSGYNMRLFPLNNEYFIICDKQENFGIYQVADGAEVWKRAGVKRFRLSNNKFAFCNSDGVEIWKME